MADEVARDRIEAVERRFDRHDRWLAHRFEGFPQEYASRLELSDVRKTLDAIRGDHVMRREVDEIKVAQTTAMEAVRKRLDESQGRRVAYTSLAAVVVTLLAVGIGISQRNAITRADIANQIQAEAPWNQDKAAILTRLNSLELQNERLTLRLSQVEQLDRFFCRTRARLLPQC